HPAGRDPAELEREAAAIRAQEAELAEQIDAARTGLDEALAHRTVAEEAFEAEERRLAALSRAAADRREGLARLSGQMEGLRRRVAAADAEVERLTQAKEAAERRGAEAQREFAALETTI